jgi:two-component system, OmpR family, response regulator VicR
MKYSILLIEDNLAICKSIMTTLENDQFSVEIANNGATAIEKFKRMTHDLILLDLILPDANGEDLLQTFRRKSNVPIIIISMKSKDIEKAINLGLGADDFLTKPFSMLELTARAKAVIRRSKYFESSTQSDVYRFEDYELNLSNYTLKRANKTIYITNKEFDILKTLVIGYDRVFSKRDLYRLVWKEEGYENDNVINVHINHLRAKIGDNLEYPRLVKTVWGFGYKIGVEVKKVSN